MRRTIAVMAASDARRAQSALDQACERLLRVLDKASAVPDAELVVSCDSSDAIAFFREITPPATSFLVHEGENQGDRLRRCFEDLCEPGRAVVVIGADAPARSLELAFDALASARVDIVLGPTDGASCLVGMTAFHPDLFAGIDWSAPRPLDEIVESAARLGLGWYLLP